MTAPLRIMLVDDHAVVRAGYRALLERQADMQVCCEAADGASAYTRAAAADLDLVVMDLSMPGQGGLECLARLHRRDPALKLLAFSMHAHASYARQAFAAGARAYVTKSSDADVLVQAVRALARGERFLSADIAQALAWERFGAGCGQLERLSVREFEILRQLLDGRHVDDIASALHVSVKTVRNQHYSIKRKLEVDDDIALVRLALRLNVIDLIDFAAPAQPV